MADHRTEEWTALFERDIRRENIKRAYKAYVENLLKSNLPPIFEFRHLCHLLGVDPPFLAKAINRAASLYRVFEIPKHRGGMRRISVPVPMLLSCQRWINTEILARIDPSVPAHGFVKGCSVITNARQHLNKRMLLKVDLQDFFGSIKIQRVVAIFLRMGFPPNVSFYLSSLCCVDRSLPQGAATSPSLSNIVCKRMDKRLLGAASRLNLTYSRYADDLSFSGDEIRPDFVGLIAKIVATEGFLLNEKKTVLARGKAKKIITGVSISNDRLKLPRAKRRKWRQELHYLLQNGIFEHMKHLARPDPLYLEQLLGRYQFWRSIEPDNAWVITGIEKINGIRNQISQY